jgi:hypothetical protein
MLCGTREVDSDRHMQRPAGQMFPCIRISIGIMECQEVTKYPGVCDGTTKKRISRYAWHEEIFNNQSFFVMERYKEEKEKLETAREEQ